MKSIAGLLLLILFLLLLAARLFGHLQPAPINPFAGRYARYMPGRPMPTENCTSFAPDFLPILYETCLLDDGGRAYVQGDWSEVTYVSFYFQERVSLIEMLLWFGRWSSFRTGRFHYAYWDTEDYHVIVSFDGWHGLRTSAFGVTITGKGKS